MVAAAERPVPSTAFGWLASRRLRERLLLLVALAGLPGMAVAFYLAASWLDNETAQIEVSVERLAKLAASRQDTVIENARLVLVGVAQRIRREALNVENCREYLSGWLDLVPVLTSLTLFDRDGGRICATDDTELPADVADKDWFNEVRQGNGFVLGGYTFGESGRPLLVAAYPLLFEQGGFRGALGLGIDLRWLDFLSQTIDLPEDTTVTAITEDGDILVHAAKGPDEEEEDVGKLPSQDALRQMATMTSGTLRATNQSGSPRVYGVQRTKSGEIVVAVGHTPYLGYARYWDAMLNTLMAPMIVLALALLAAGYGAETLVARYVRSLTRTAETIAGGDTSARSEVPYSLYEIGQLAKALDSMAAALGDDNAKLGSLVEQRETLIRELNHRVKNNMQIVLSMMRGAGADTSDPKVQERIAALSGRIETLAQIHELLYQRYDTEVPPLASYVQELSTLLGDFYEEEVGPARVSAVDDIELSIGQCISFGLILNELVANAHKHAFTDERRGRIGVEVVGEPSDAGHDVHLIVSDDGKGLPEDFSLDDATSTGSRLMRGLTRQLRGEFWSERLERGTAMHVRFPAAE